MQFIIDVTEKILSMDSMSTLNVLLTNSDQVYHFLFIHYDVITIESEDDKWVNG